MPVEQIKTKHLLSNMTTYYLPLFKHGCMFWPNDDHNQASNTKSQCNVKYNAIICTVWDPIELE